MDVLSRCACGGAPALYAPDVKSETKYAASVVCHHCGVSMQMANHDSDPKRVVAAWNRAHPHRINTMTVNEKGLEAAQVAAREGCGLFIESQHVFCDDPVVGEAADGYGKPLRQPYCSCKGDAERIIKAYLRASSSPSTEDVMGEARGALAIALSAIEKAGDDLQASGAYPVGALAALIVPAEQVRTAITNIDRALSSKQRSGE